MNDKDIDIWKEKTKGIFHITEHRRFWNYITNLQEENEHLQKQNKGLNNLIFQHIDEEDNLIDYKSRNEKAIEFVKKESKKCYSNQTTDDPQKVIGNFMWHTDKLLDILNGGDEEC